MVGAGLHIQHQRIRRVSLGHQHSHRQATAMKIFFVIILISLILSPVVGYAQECPEGRVCLKNPLESIDISSPGELVYNQFRNFVGIMAILAIIFTVFSGFKLILASDEEAIQGARSSITWSVGGFVVALLSFTIVSSIGQLIGFDPGTVD